MNRKDYKEYRLGNICSRLSSGKGITAEYIYEEGQYPVFGGNGLRGYTSSNNFSGTCAIIGRQGAYCGNVKYFEGEAYMTEHAVVVVANPEHNTRYLSFVLDGLKLGRLSGQAAQPGLSVKQLAKIRVFMPPKAYQDKVSGILTKYDQAIENNNKRIKILEQMAENLYKEWFVRFRFHGYEDVEWVEDRADELFDITIGKTPSRQDFDAFVSGEENAIDWVSISDMKSMYIGNTNEQLTIDAVKNYKVVRVPKKTILLSFKLTVGRVAITTKESCTNEAIAHFKNVDEEYIEYLYLYLKLFDYNTLGNTSAIGNAINSKIVKAMKIKVPDKDTAIRFHDVAGKIFDEILVLNQKNMNLTKQRDLLLPRLMSGKLKLK